MRQFLVIHPFLFAIFPVLFLFAYNIDEVFVGHIWLSLLIVIVAVLVLFLLLKLIVKSYRKGGIIASCLLLLFFSYRHIRDLLPSLEIGKFNIMSGYFVGFSWIILFSVVAFLVIRSRRNFLILTKFLNVAAISLIIISLINIGIFEIKAFGRLENETLPALDVSNIDNLPDIYYIILDSYARQDVLKEKYNYDNSEFIDFLSSRGFYVANKSSSNYFKTLWSLASSLNMEYVDYLAEEKRGLGLELEMIQNNKVSRILKHAGYRYIYVSSGFFEGNISKYAEVYTATYGFKMNYFELSLLETTALRPFVSIFINSSKIDHMLYEFDKLANLPDYQQPVFVFSHIYAPHGPFVIDRYGNPVEEGKGTYLGQLIFVNQKVEALVDKLLLHDPLPIIILQGDHGPPKEDSGEKILNAYFLPRKDAHSLYETISPVNSFRIIFNLYFNADYELLEDRTLFRT